MAKINVYDQTGENVETITLKDEVFGVEYNEALIHQVVVAQLANMRQGTQSALTRSEVRGHAKKPWAQKHTGRARHGSTKGPQWRGGGMVFAVKPRDYTQKINKQMKAQAFVSAISAKLAQNDIVVVNDIKLEEAKTKLMQNVLNNLKLEKSILLVINGENQNVVRASKNIPTINFINSDLLSVYEIVSSGKLLITKDAIKSIEEAYKA
ncbi:MAG: 50S ribosomal protein L4 [Bacilli bacterium]